MSGLIFKVSCLMFPHFTFIGHIRSHTSNRSAICPSIYTTCFQSFIARFLYLLDCFQKIFPESIWNLHMTIACLGTLSLPSPFSFSVFNVFLTFGLVLAVLDFYLAPFKLFFLKFTLSFSVCVTLLSSGAIETSDHE